VGKRASVRPERRAASSPNEIIRNRAECANLNPDLYLLGTGIYSFFDISLYTQSVLRKCSTVFYLHDLPTLDKYLKQITAKPINLMPLYYSDGRDRSRIYEDIVVHVLQAVTKERPIALLLHGNPILYSTVSQRLLKKCAERGITIEIVPAISCLDRIFVDLRIDIAERGLQVYEASRTVHMSVPIVNSVDLLILQVGSVRNPNAARNQPAAAEDALELKAYLGKFYPPDHLMYIVESAVEIGFETLITPVRLTEFEQMTTRMTYTASLFVPATGLSPTG
jgi:uncharacterized protein YabN with tetrapyrrole methylase and pyrophosphatase domain